MEESRRPRTDAERAERRRRKRRRARRKKLIIWGSVIALLVALCLGGFFYYRNLRHNTASYFTSQPKTTEAPAETPAQDAPESSAPAEAAVTATPASGDYDALKQQADTSMMQNIVNVLLVGVDYSEERLTEEWLESGGSTAEHADVMIVLAINFDKQTVDMISLPRDTYAKIPGVQGLYKLNASLDCGGGLFEKDENGQWIKDANGKYKVNSAGFDKVCEACSWMLGDIPINYYYAVTMPAVKELVNAIGGVDYNLDVSFTMQGRTYEAGQQHMDGQAVLDYLRVRKGASGLDADETGDGKRVNRQKDMLVAILNQLRDKGMLLKIPDILQSFDGQLFTNCSFEQTAALALYAYDMPSDNIRMWSMDGIWSSKKSAKLNFCFTDQEKRVSIIKEVYGVDVPEYRDCKMAYAYYFWNDLQAERYISTTHPLKKYVKELGGYDDFLRDYDKVRSLKASAERAAEAYLAGESNYLREPTEQLEEALEILRVSALAAKSARGY